MPHNTDVIGKLFKLYVTQIKRHLLRPEQITITIFKFKLLNYTCRTLEGIHWEEVEEIYQHVIFVSIIMLFINLK